MNRYFKEDFKGFEDKGLRIIFFIGIIITIVIAPTYNYISFKYNEHEINKKGIIITGTIVEIERVNKRLPNAIYKFVVNNKIYYGKSEFNYSDSLEIGDQVLIKYLPLNPKMNQIYKNEFLLKLE